MYLNDVTRFCVSRKKVILIHIIAYCLKLLKIFNLRKYIVCVLLATVIYRLLRNWNLMTSGTGVDVVVIGSGLAGLTSAFQLAQRRQRVILLEKSSSFGGNSIKASSGINGVPTKYQPVWGDSVDLFYSDTLRSGKGACTDDLVRLLVEKSLSAIDWLVSLGIDLLAVAQLGGHSMPRTHRGSSNTTPAMISTLMAKVLDNPYIDVLFNAKLTKINMKGSVVESVEYLIDHNKVTLGTKNLVLATGGYAADTETIDSLVKQYRPDLLELPTTNADGITGDGQKIASRDCHAKLMDMTEIQINPTGFVNLTVEGANTRSKILCAELLRGVGGILVSPNTGQRFVDEMQTRDIVAEAVKQNCGLEGGPYSKAQKSLGLIIIDEADTDKAFSHINFYYHRGLLKKGTVADIAEFCQKVNPEFKAEWLEKTFVSLKQAVPNGKDEFGRTVFGSPFSSKQFWYGFVTPVLHFSMGGIAINENAQAYSTDGQAIKNLYAIGEIAAGVHGHNRLGGNSLLECVVFGTIAVESICKKS